MTLYVNGVAVLDDWQIVADEATIPASGRIIVPLAVWLAQRDALLPRLARGDLARGEIGLALAPAAALRLDEVAADLSGFGVIALDFPVFNDGRAFSMARRLRGQYGYTGALRATGDVLIDQIQMMQRCGFDSFVVRDPYTERMLAAGHWPGLSLFCQPSGRSGEHEAGTRPWLRRA
jgi:phosphoadenosine phosphosulfate reductase